MAGQKNRRKKKREKKARRNPKIMFGKMFF
jgi:hypothetical protein